MNRRVRMETAIKSIPFDRIDQNASEAIRDVLNNPSFYRQLPQRTLDCDPQLLTFMVRHPEVMVNIWEMIGITNIKAQRTGDHTFSADDGAGTKCNCELVYSDDSLHIYYGTGNYDGMMVPRTIKGRVVCVLRSQAQPGGVGHSGYTVNSTMDVFLKVDNLGADLLTRTLGPLVGKVTEHNFEETSKFVGHFSEFCANYPNAALSLAGQLRVEDESIRREFVTIASRIGGEHQRVKMGSIPGDVRAVVKHQNPANVERSASVDSLELKDSLGQIQLATLPELAVQADFSDEQGQIVLEQEGGQFESTERLDSLFPEQISRNPELRNPDTRNPDTISQAPKGTGSGSTGLAVANPADRAINRPPSGIVPRRTGVSLRR